MRITDTLIERVRREADLMALVRDSGVKLRKSGKEWKGLCPFHEENTPSFSINADSGLYHCFGCDAGGDAIEFQQQIGSLTFQEAVVSLALRSGIDIAENSGDVTGTADKQPEAEPEQVSYGCTVEQYAGRTGLPIEWLTGDEVGLEDAKCWINEEVGEVPAVRVPYKDLDGKTISVKYRVVVAGKDKYRFDKGAKPAVYGEQWADFARTKKKIFVVEGESDAQTLHYHQIPAFGIPGSGMTQVIEARHLEGIQQVYVVQELDAAGEDFPRRVQDRLVELDSRIPVLVMKLPAKDTNEMYLEDPGRFKREFLRIHLYCRGLSESSISPSAFKTVRDICNTEYPPIRWIVKGLIRTGLAVLFSAPKVGKTQARTQIEAAVSRGEPCFGDWEIEDPGEVLCIDLEEIIGADMKDRLLAHGGLKDQHRIYTIDEWPRIGSGGLRELDIWLTEHPSCRLVSVDVWTLIKPHAARGSNAYDAEYNTLRQLSILMKRHDACCLLVHHDRKGSEGGITDRQSGSKALPGAATSIMWFRREVGETEGSLTVTGRGVPEMALPATFDKRRLQWDIPKPMSY